MSAAAGSNSLVLKSERYVVCLNFSMKRRSLVELFFNRIGKKAVRWSSPPTAQRNNDKNKGDLTVADPEFPGREGRRPAGKWRIGGRGLISRQIIFGQFTREISPYICQACCIHVPKDTMLLDKRI